MRRGFMVPLVPAIAVILIVVSIVGFAIIKPKNSTDSSSRNISTSLAGKVLHFLGASTEQPSPSPSPQSSPTLNPTATPTPSATPSAPNTFYPIEMKVWMIQYIPPVGIKAKFPAAPIADTVAFSRNTLIAGMNNASKYHGYLDPSAKPSLNFTLSDSDIVVENNPPPKYDISPGRKMFDYSALFNKYDLCHVAKVKDIKVVFVWAAGDANEEYAGWLGESAITGNKIPVTNGPVLGDCPGKTITIFGFNYQTDVSPLEPFGHHIEAVMRKFRPEYQFWTDKDSCGTVHNPPNFRFEYDRSNTADFQSDCRNWKPDGTGVKETLNCRAWNCDIDKGWIAWWMQNLPGLGNNLYLNGEKLPNWWVYIGDPDKCVIDPYNCSQR